MVPDLRLCTVRPVNDNDRRFVFEILSPNRWVTLPSHYSRRMDLFGLVRICSKRTLKVNAISG